MFGSGTVVSCGIQFFLVLQPFPVTFRQLPRQDRPLTQSSFTCMPAEASQSTSWPIAHANTDAAALEGLPTQTWNCLLTFWINFRNLPPFYVQNHIVFWVNFYSSDILTMPWLTVRRTLLWHKLGTRNHWCQPPQEWLLCMQQIHFQQVTACVRTWRKPRRRWTEKKMSTTTRIAQVTAGQTSLTAPTQTTNLAIEPPLLTWRNNIDQILHMGPDR